MKKLTRTHMMMIDNDDGDDTGRAEGIINIRHLS